MEREQKIDLIKIAVAAVLLVAAWLLPISGVWRLVAFSVPYAVVGFDVVLGAVKSVFKREFEGELFLMSIATLGAIGLGEYPEAVGVMIFFKIGELFEDIAVGRSRKSIEELMDVRPDYAVVIRDDEEIKLASTDVDIGETIIVRSGERVPLDGVIVDGSASLNTSALTGESLPRDVKCGDGVSSGTVSLNGVLKIRTTSSFNESTVNKVLSLIESASEKKAKSENFIERFSKIYTPTVVLAAVLLGIIPPLFGGEWSVWINRALIFLMVSCPCALVVSVPMTYFCGIGGASKKGILIKGATYIEALSRVKTVVLDKTGTLTKGVFEVNAVHSNRVSESELLDIAALLESYSTHPVATSIIAAHEGHIDKSRVGNIEELAGLGVSAEIDGEKYYAGNALLMEKACASYIDCELIGTIVHISKGADYLGHIVVNDIIKKDAALAISELKAVGVETVMLTGDKKSVAERCAEAVGVGGYYAELLPHDKVTRLEELIESGEKSKTAFVGDGINDAPVITRADVGIAMGAMGSDAAIEAADVVLMDDSPVKIPLAIKIAKKTMTIAYQNIVLALAVKAVVLALSAIGLTNMWLAVFGDVGVLIVAVINAMRAMKNGEKRTRKKAAVNCLTNQN